jgi:hypothetical protein
VTDLIRAFAPIARAHPGASLDIVGDNRSYPREDLPRTIAGEQLEAQVRWHEYVSDEQLGTLYAEARAFAFLSEYEGLGLTPLEALAAGVPPVLLDTPVARESCGDAAVYVPVSDLPATTRANSLPSTRPCGSGSSAPRPRNWRIQLATHGAGDARALEAAGSGQRVARLKPDATRGLRYGWSLCPVCPRWCSFDNLSIIIVSFNARADLERCLESLHAARPAAPHEILVVDNGSTDGSADAGRRWPDVKVIEAGANLGFARANNIGIRASDGANLLLLNSDTVVPAGAIDRLLAELDRHEAVAVVGPRLVDADGRAELSFGRMIGPLNELRQKRRLRSGAVEHLTRRRHYPDWVSGACLVVRRADAEAVGGLDERMCAKTSISAPRYVRADARSFTPDVEVVHVGGRSAASDPAATRDHRRANWRSTRNTTAVGAAAEACQDLLVGRAEE